MPTLGNRHFLLRLTPYLAPFTHVEDGNCREPAEREGDTERSIVPLRTGQGLVSRARPARRSAPLLVMPGVVDGAQNVWFLLLVGSVGSMPSS